VRDALGAVQRILVLGAGRDVDPRDLEARTESDVTVEWFDARATGEHARLLDDLWQRHGGFDVVVLAFGLQGDQLRAETDTAHALEIVETNYLGAVSASLEVARLLRRQGHGALVILSSVAAERTRRSLFVYASSKAGVDSFALGLGDALRTDGIDVLVVRPGFVHTKLTAGLKPAPFATTPEAVAELVDRGLRRRARIVWAPPQMRWVMVLLRHLPHAVFRRLPI
jgi:decaprenylphospho-beta-D-erythro-pentofuranosid-2-ulose 2-reductase